jgi:glycosyltransferase involved in cell wall biosynthesis
MTSAPLMTVIIDAYNYGRFIEQAIDSVLSQDFPA